MWRTMRKADAASAHCSRLGRLRVDPGSADIQVLRLIAKLFIAMALS